MNGDPKDRIEAFLRIAAVGAAMLAAACSATPEISDESQARTLEFRKLYFMGSPGWNEAKERWIDLGETERTCLVNFLILDMKKNAIKYRRGPGGEPEPGWKRPVRELVSLGDMTIEPLIDALRVLRDETTVVPCIEALAEVIYLDDAKAALAAARSDGDVTLECRLVRTLLLMDDPGALDEALGILLHPGHWQVRATAADYLARYGGDRIGEVRAALTEVLADDDAFLKKKAAAALETLPPE